MVDVIIPVYRPDEKLEKLIGQLKIQTMKPSHIFFLQTMVGDSEDKRVEKILKEAEHAKVIPVDKDEFDHGGTRNQGAALSDAQYMLFMTQDAVPEDEYLIENMYRHITSDEKIATAYARQMPDEAAGPIESYTRKFNYPEQSSVKSADDLERLGIKTYFCSNACAMYKKSVYGELGGFVTETIFNEDMIFASRVIGAGYKIAYAADARVIHSHKYTYREQLTRNFDLGVSQRQYREIFENIRSESEGIRLIKDAIRYLARCGKWYLIPDLIFQSGFKFIGYRLGLKYEKLPGWLVKKLSMNKRYWSGRC